MHIKTESQTVLRHSNNYYMMTDTDSSSNHDSADNIADRQYCAVKGGDIRVKKVLSYGEVRLNYLALM